MNSKNLSLSRLKDMNPRLEEMGIKDIAYSPAQDVYYGLFGAAFSAPHTIKKLWFVDAGDSVRLDRIEPVKDLPMTFMDGILEIQRLADK